MKKAIFISIFLSVFIAFGACSLVVYSSDINNYDGPSGGVLCNKKKTRCTVGKVVMRGSISRPLYVRDGIICNYKRTRCTNGYTIIKSSKPQY